jgi:hypothetical protein
MTTMVTQQQYEEQKFPSPLLPKPKDITEDLLESSGLSYILL